MRLDLRAPLFYLKFPASEEKELIYSFPEDDEMLLCYELNPKESRSIEPDMTRFLGSLIYAGRKLKKDAVNKEPAFSQEVCLPQGVYLFVQQRSDRALNKNEWLEMAIEQHKDCLWERCNPGDLLYVRFLYEDHSYVTQLFRPAGS